MSAADLINQFLGPVAAGLGALVVAIMAAAAVIIRSHASTVKHQTEAAQKEKELFIGVVGDLRGEVASLRNDYREEVRRGNEQENKIRELLEKLAEIPRLELEIEKARGEVAGLKHEVDDIRSAREQRERELLEERTQRRNAETQLKELQELFALETANWQIEREALNLRIDDLKAQVDKLTPRITNVEDIVRQTPVSELPAVSSEEGAA